MVRGQSPDSYSTRLLSETNIEGPEPKLEGKGSSEGSDARDDQEGVVRGRTLVDKARRLSWHSQCGDVHLDLCAPVAP